MKNKKNIIWNINYSINNFPIEIKKKFDEIYYQERKNFVFW